MTKYVIKNQNNRFWKISEDATSRDYWINNYYEANSYEEITDADYDAFIRGDKDFTSHDPLDKTLIDVNPVEGNITFDQVKEKLNYLINKIEKIINANQNPPAIWTTNLNTLKGIDLDTLTFPGTANNWIDFLRNNNIVIPSVMEF